MKVRYIGVTDNMVLTHGKAYTVIAVEKGWYRIETDMLGDYLFHPQQFEEMDPLTNAKKLPKPAVVPAE